MTIENSGYILRSGIMRKFNNLTKERIIYVCAPAGYGKTVAVRQWLQSIESVKTLISLDEYDNNLAHFCRRFCAALLDCQPQNTALKEFASHPAFDGAPEEFTLRAIIALLEIKHAVFVIDDLHFLQNKKVLNFLLVLLKRLPEAFRIVLISRNKLSPGFADLWIRGHLVRITADELRFSGEEIMLLCRKHGGTVTSEQADGIFRFTGGWAIGVNALLLSGGTPDGERLEVLDDFIQANIWEHWDEDTREFMLKTSIVNELTPSLCAALTDDDSSDKTLKSLMAKNAFVSQEHEEVYRYHHLFKIFLNRMAEERGKEFIRTQWEKAGKWYLSQNDFYNSLDYFVKCKSHDGIFQSFGLLVTAGREYFFVEKLMSIAHIPIINQVAEKFPYIYSILSWAAFNNGQAAEMAIYADLYYKNQQEIVRLDPRLKFNIALVRLIDYRISLRDLTQLSIETTENSSMKSLSDMGVSMGTINQNLPLLHRGTRDFSECAAENTEANIMRIKAAFGSLFGEEMILLAECLTAGLLYEQGFLEKALVHALASNAEIKMKTVSESKFFAMTALVYIYDALNQPIEAEKVLKRIGEMIERDRAYYLSSNHKALIIRRKLEKGDMKTASKWITEHDAALTENLSFHEIYETFTVCRAYISVGDYGSAIILLTKTLELVRSYNRPMDIIEAQILLSIAYWKKKRGFQEEAMQYLENAVFMAHGFGYTQMFINEGAELAGMLRRMQKKSEQRAHGDIAPTSFIKMLCLSAQEHHGSGLTSGQPEKPLKFTDKQKTVIKLICEGKSYKEITEIIGIKLPTLRSHISLIYSKLDVTCETDAIKKIKSQDILDDM